MINKKTKIGFIGAGYMGEGMAHNLLKNKISLSVIANKNRKPIDRLVSQGAQELSSFEELSNNSEVILMCVSNTLTAIEIINKLLPHLKTLTLFIDLTTHHADGSVQINEMLKSKNIRYVEAPVLGGPLQAEEGVLGAIVGAKNDDFVDAKNILMNFCKDVFYFGEIGMGAKTKLVSNFLSLGTTTFVIEALKAVKHLNIDLNKFYEVSKLGSGNSGALNRIASKAIEGDFKGYIFSVNNTLKDLSYINDLLKDLPNAEKLSALTKSFYKEEADNGKGNLLISELINK